MEQLKEYLIERGAIFTPSDEDGVKNVENIVGMALPEDYRVYLREMGTIFLAGKEFYGAGVPEGYYLNAGTALKKLRTFPDYPAFMLPLVSSGDGAWFLYDCQRESVFSWQVAGDVDDQKKSLEAFIREFFQA
ncbi:SMI1/KNR4 family protein [Bombella sp. TMW 2.2543]|uniref:SMI1/KNR4 family protein n=1 Tax=Bombella pluederhausensis TaxID=2967336 RepID=A0ABT3WIU4_9PROT|nr:SMI1/KNR4 family protein [Bombella pluederhausensis]MCX5618120.1 SMI1/KNR4 family protein [Bombella pluederhausensis]